MHSYIEADPGLQASFEREAKVIAALRHPNIVQVLDFNVADGHPYIVMEYLPGPSLAVYLRELNSRNEKLQLPQSARLLSFLANALDYAHEQGVIHRDISQATLSCTTKLACFQAICHLAGTPSLSSRILAWSASIPQPKRRWAKGAGRQPICPLSRPMV